jgi:nucleotide-binding universal stress UspA family protein
LLALCPCCREAARLDAAALVMFSQGKNRLVEAMLGSISSFCLHHSPVPLVLLHA